MEEAKARIMVVDDEPEIVQLWKHFLSDKGYEAVGASSGEEALSILEKEKADLILLDMMMPGISGREAAEIIKKRYPSIKIIMITGYPSESSNLVGDNYVECVFIKPIRIQEIYNKLAEVLSHKEVPNLGLKPRQGIMARIFLIKAKLLILEPSVEVYNNLKSHFKMLSSAGNDYDLDTAGNEETFKEKLPLFNPDIIVANASIFNKYDQDMLAAVQGKNGLKEIIIYNLKNNAGLQHTELERLTKAVQTTCLKNGLLEVKWIEI